MSRDGLLPPVASRIHPKYHTPHVSTILVGVVVTALAGLLPIGIVAELLSIGTLMAFVIVCIGVLALRIMQPKLERPFRPPAVYVVAPLGALSAIGLMLGLPQTTWSRLVIWMVIGVAIYFVYGIRHNVVARSRRTA